ncbi:MAG TPA: OsmC family protein [Alicyclobacillus sp.]|nr:OsmC family protein [Kyrpidia spormannii]HHY67474.1 OsmC family protein [Alicyclobacillus sp.]
MRVDVKWLGKRAFEALGQTSGHTVRIDAAESAGGEGSGVRPMEMLLMGVGGCTGIDIAMILEKMRLHIDRFEMTLNAERAEKHPQRFTKITVDYVLDGPDLTHEKVKRAVELSYHTYCSALNSLNADFEIRYTLNGETRTVVPASAESVGGRA